MQIKVKVGSYWSVQLHRRLVVKQSWDLIGQHGCECDLAYTASKVMLCSCGKLIITTVPELRSDWHVEIPQGFGPSSPDPFPPWRWGLGTRLYPPSGFP